MSKLTLLLVGLVGGIAGGFLASSLFGTGPDGSAPKDTAPQLGEYSGHVEASGESEAQGVQRLAAEIETLRNQVLNLSNQVENRREISPVSSLADSEAFDEIASLLAAESDGDPGSGILEEKISSVLDAREAAEQKAREERRAEQNAQRMERRVARLAEELGLDQFQSDQMSQILTEQDKLRSEMFAGMRNNDGQWDREGIREKMEAMNTRTNDLLANVLTPGQLTQYKESNSGGWGGMRGFDGGGRGAGTPRGGGNNGGGRNRGGGF